MFSACSSGFVQNKSILVVDPLGHFAYHKDMAESKDDLRVILDAKSSSLATRIAMESYSKMNIPTIKREEIVPIYTVGIEESKQPSSPVPSSASPVPSSASSVPGRATIYPAALPGPLNRKVFSQESLSGSVSRSQSFSLSPYSLSSPSPVRAAAPAIGFDRPVQQKKLQVVVSYLGVDYPAVDVDLCASSRQFKDKKRSLLESQISAAVLFRSAALQSSPPAAASSSSSAVAVVSSPSQKLFGYFNEEEKCLKIFDPIRRVEIEKELDDVLLTGQIKSIVQSAKDNLVSFVSSGLDIKVKIYGEEYDAVSVDRNFIIPDVLSGRGAIIFFGEKNGDGADIYIYNPKKIHTIHVSDSVLSMCGITEIASASREDNRLAFAGVVGVADSPDTPVHSRTFA
jgi:hypothetical protein